jgi:hypothetical protein
MSFPASLTKPTADSLPAEKPVTKRLAGYWKNKWRVELFALDVHSGQLVDGGEVFGSKRYPSAEIAEHEALELIRETETLNEYLGPVFFPEGAP